MENNNLENNIKDSFEHYLPQLDNDEIWDNIEPHLKKKKKRRFFFIWFLGGITLLGFLFMYFSNTEVPPTQYHQANNKSEAIVSSKVSEDPSIIASSTDSKIEQAIIEKEYPTSKTQAIIETSYVVQKSANTSSPLSINSDFPTVENEISISNDKIIPPESMVESTVLENEILEQEVNVVAEKTIKEELTAQESIVEESPLVVESIDEDLEEIVEEIKEEEKEEKAPKVIDPFKNTVRWFIQPTASAIAPLRILNARQGFGETNYLKERKETERQLEAFAFGLNVQAQTQRGFVMMTGIEIQRLNGRMDFEEKTETQETVVGIISTTENALGETIRVNSGLKERTTRTTRTQRYFNHHTFVNIPIGIGKFWHKPKYDLRFMTGLDINVYHNFRGLIKGENGDLDLRHKESAAFDQVFKRKTGLGFWLSTEFHKPMNERFSWSIAPKIQLPFSKITQDDYALRQRFINISLTLGANYLIQSKKNKK